MTRFLESMGELAEEYDAIVLDQWGVLHDGSSPYPSAVEALTTLHRKGARLAVLSNSGKRAAPNSARIADMGFPETLFEFVMTGGEALWRDMNDGKISERRLFPIERTPGDAAVWASGLDVALTDRVEMADALLLMGLPDGSDRESHRTTLAHARERGLPLLCSNPDRISPRANAFAVSPGVLAQAYRDSGGEVRFYGKPHPPVFRALSIALATERLVMVGDSLEHDIAGAADAGWDTVFIRGGIHAPAFRCDDVAASLERLIEAEGAITPSYSLEVLR